MAALSAIGKHLETGPWAAAGRTGGERTERPALPQGWLTVSRL